MNWLKNIFGNREKKQSETTGKQSASDQDTHSISAVEVKRKLDAGAPFVLLDVRQPEEVEICSIQEAVCIPMGEIHARYSELGDTSREVVVFCHHGMRSERVMHQLWGLGYQNAKNMEGGIDAWSIDVDPSVPRY